MKEAHQFEGYALSLLRAEANEQGKSLLTSNELSEELAFADAVAPQGLFNLPGPVFVEIKVKYSERFFDYFERVKSYPTDVGSFIFVFQEGKIPEERISQVVRRGFPNFGLQILGREDLARLAEKHPDAALPFNSQYLGSAIDTFKARDERKSFDQHLTALRSAYSDDRLALFLGSGVSKSAKFPDWPELVKRMALSIFDDSVGATLSDAEKEEIYHYFQSESPSSPIIVARLLQSNLKDKFPTRVKTALYSGTSEANSSNLLDEIGSLCMPQRDRIGVVSVVNYNFDDLLETELARRTIPYRVVLCDSDEPSKSELPIYHVHGFLPRVGTLTELQRQTLVFSEDAYHQQFLDPYLWTNITQLNLLRHNVCLFIGLSMTDPNQRRLLEITISKKPGVRHYAILRDHWIGKQFSTLTPNGQVLAKVFKGLEESALSNLGISVLWVSSFDDIAPLLRQIKN